MKKVFIALSLVICIAGIFAWVHEITDPVSYFSRQCEIAWNYFSGRVPQSVVTHCPLANTCVTQYANKVITVHNDRFFAAAGVDGDTYRLELSFDDGVDINGVEISVEREDSHFQFHIKGQKRKYVNSAEINADELESVAGCKFINAQYTDFHDKIMVPSVVEDGLQICFEHMKMLHPGVPNGTALNIHARVYVVVMNLEPIEKVLLSHHKILKLSH